MSFFHLCLPHKEVKKHFLMVMGRPYIGEIILNLVLS